MAWTKAPEAAATPAGSPFTYSVAPLPSSKTPATCAHCRSGKARARSTRLSHLPARGDVEADLPAVADAEEEADRLAVLLLQQRGVVERVRPERDPALDRERAGERRHFRGGDDHVRGDAVELERLARDARHEPAVAEHGVPRCRRVVAHAHPALGAGGQRVEAPPRERRSSDARRGSQRSSERQAAGDGGPRPAGAHERFKPLPVMGLGGVNE